MKKLLPKIRLLGVSTPEQYRYIASLYRPANNRFLISRTITTAQVIELGKHRFDFIILHGQTKTRVGWVALVPYQKKKTAKIILIIDEPYQHQGYATATFPAIIKKAKSLGFSRLTLEVMVGHKVAIKLYKQAGFQALATVIKMERKI